MFEITMKAIHPEFNCFREYTIRYIDTLFGPTLVSAWGRVGGTPRMKHHVCSSKNEEYSVIASLLKKRFTRSIKRKHQYKICGITCDDPKLTDQVIKILNAH